MADATDVSIVIPTYNRATKVVRTIQSLLKLSTSYSYEIVVIDDGSTDNTEQLVKGIVAKSKYPKVSYVKSINKGPASARNLGIKKARGDYIAFTDSDCIPDEEWLQHLMNKIKQNDQIGGVGGVTRGLGKSLIDDLVDKLKLLDPLPQKGDIEQLVTCNACFKKSILTQVGLFDERFLFPGCEDTELSYRVSKAGYSLLLEPKALVIHEHKQNLHELLKTMYKYGTGRYLMAKIWPEKTVVKPYKFLLVLVWKMRTIPKSAWLYRKRGYIYALRFEIIGRLTNIAFLVGYIRGNKTYKEAYLLKARY